MEIKTFDLYKIFDAQKPNGAQGVLTAFIHQKTARDPEGRKRPAMLVLGGGGYEYVSVNEKEPIALYFFAQGFNVFVLEYSCKPFPYPVALTEAAMATAYIRENAEQFNLIPDRICAIGFSAGGHLCGSLAFLYKEDEVKKILGDKYALCRPDAIVLSYPVITSGEFAHKGSIDVLSMGNKEIEEKVSLENRVTPDAPPAFIWTTTNDDGVPSENSLLLAVAYRKAGVPFELHMFENGFHGLSLATQETHYVNEAVAQWTTLVSVWLKNRGFELTE